MSIAELHHRACQALPSHLRSALVCLSPSHHLLTNSRWSRRRQRRHIRNMLQPLLLLLLLLLHITRSNRSCAACGAVATCRSWCVVSSIDVIIQWRRRDVTITWLLDVVLAGRRTGLVMIWTWSTRDSKTWKRSRNSIRCCCSRSATTATMRTSSRASFVSNLLLLVAMYIVLSCLSRVLFCCDVTATETMAQHCDKKTAPAAAAAAAHWLMSTRWSCRCCCWCCCCWWSQYISWKALMLWSSECCLLQQLLSLHHSLSTTISSTAQHCAACTLHHCPVCLSSTDIPQLLFFSLPFSPKVRNRSEIWPQCVNWARRR